MPFLGHQRGRRYGQVMTQPTPEQPPEGLSMMIEPSAIGGVYANHARVTHSEYEFTLDFVRLDFAGGPHKLVARVIMSPLLMSQLQDAIADNWQSYSEKAMPPEVRGSDE